MRIVLVTCLCLFTFSSLAYAQQKVSNKTEVVKEEAQLIGQGKAKTIILPYSKQNARPFKEGYILMQAPLATEGALVHYTNASYGGEFETIPEVLLEMPVGLLNKTLLELDKLFVMYRGQESRIKTIELGLGVDTEGNVYIARIKGSATLTITLEGKTVN
ncbi:hypothetical protein KJ830_01000 [bacterium]|nr:hypothetical protein [bacterium]